MENRTILIILGVIVAAAVIIGILLAGFISLGGADFIMEGTGSGVTIPGNYTMDDKSYTAYNEDNGVNITIMEDSAPDKVEKFYGAIRDNGKDSGYENVTNTTINGYAAYEFAAHPDQLKNVSTNRVSEGNYETWTEYGPEAAGTFDYPVDHFRSITYVKDGKSNTLLISTKNPNTNLYTPEFDAIINSIAAITDK